MFFELEILEERGRRSWSILELQKVSEDTEILFFEPFGRAESICDAPNRSQDTEKRVRRVS